MTANGAGVLMLESEVRGRVVERDGCRPFTPVVLVDGEPALTGFGVADVDVPAGRRLVEVQSAGSAGYWTVDVRDGGWFRLTSFVEQDHGGATRPSELLRRSALVPTRALPPRLSQRFVIAAAAIGVLAGFVPHALLVGALRATSAWVELFGAIAIFAATGVGCYVLARLLTPALTALRSRKAVTGRVPVGRHEARTFAGGEWRPVDPRASDDSVDETGAGRLRLTLAFLQEPLPEDDPVDADVETRVLDEEALVKATERRRLVGEDYPPLVRPWVDRPIVAIDGQEAPAIWGVNEYRLEAGRHRVEVRVPPPPEVLVDGDTVVELGPDAEVAAEIDVPGRGVGVEALATITMVPEHDGWELKRYVGRMRLFEEDAA